MKTCTFATAINCIDGRTHEPVMKFLKEKFHITCVDLITEPGVDKILSQKSPRSTVASIQKRAWVSVKAHQSRVIAVVGHYDCAGNPGTVQQHFKQVRKAVDVICSWGLDVTVVGLWVDRNFNAKQIVLKKLPS